MKTIKAIFNNLFIFNKEENVICDSCSYYEDGIVDDSTAFVNTSNLQRGWILDYVKNTFGK